MKKKVLAVLLTMTLAAGLLAGCSGGNQENEKEKAEGGVTITLGTPAETLYDIDKQLIKEYEEYSGNRVDIQEIPTDQYNNVMKTKLASKQAPDIILTQAEANAAKFFPDENFVDLSEEEWLTRQTESAVRNQTFNDRIIGWGAQGGDYGWGVIYNKAVFEKAGVTELPSNTEEMREACEKIQAAGYVPIAGSFKDEWTLGIWMATLGPLACQEIPDYYQKLIDNEAGFKDSKVFAQFINEFKEFYDEGYFGEGALSDGISDACVNVVEGTAAMSLNSCTPDGFLRDLNVGFEPGEIGLFPVPFADNNMLCSYDGSYIRCINANSKNIEACKDYFNFISKSENLEKYYSSPDRTMICPAFTEFADQFKWEETTEELIANSNGESYTIAEVGITYWDSTVIGKNIVDVLLDNQTADDALSNIDKERQKMFEAMEE